MITIQQSLISNHNQLLTRHKSRIQLESVQLLSLEPIRSRSKQTTMI